MGRKSRTTVVAGQGPSGPPHICPECGHRDPAHGARGESPPRTRPRARRPWLLAFGLLLLLTPVLARYWVGPLAHAFLSLRGPGNPSVIVEEVGRRFLFAAVSTAAALSGLFALTAALRGRRADRP